jgi:hypothetical protein
MRRTCMIAVLTAAWMALSTATASAQMFPGRYRNNSSYDMDAYDAAVGINALNSANNAARSTAQAYQAWSQQSSQQMAATQSDIRSAMDAGAQQRAQNIYGQQQASRDWWFQTQQQQAAQRQAEAAQQQDQPAPRQVQATQRQYSAAPQPAPTPQRQDLDAQWRDQEAQWQDQAVRRQEHAALFNSGFESAPPDMPRAATDIIKWLPLLQAPQFAAERARVEAPYRRSSKGPIIPTAKDYQDMIAATGQMKVILKGMVTYITAQQYLNAEAFLDQLAAEARGRLEMAAPKK